MASLRVDRLVAVAAGIVFVIGLTVSTAFAQAPDTATASATPPVLPAPGEPAALARAADVADLSAYVDGVVEGYMRRLGIAGVTVAVVDAHGPLLLRGYGVAGQAPERKVDPARTLFRVGSVSKTFTYLEALKLVDAGTLALDAPVNQYLPADIQLADDGYKPVLLRHLLTHTAGFEDSALGHLFAKAPQDAPSLHDYLQRHRPARVREPGTHAVYSNYSLALLGAVLANVTGVPFEELTERDLFGPMRMRLTTFREPLLAADPRTAGPQFKGLWSDGFARKGGGFAKQDFEHIAQVAPAGSVSSNAADMARYVRMLVNRGQLDGTRVVPASAFARLEAEPLFRNAPDATGFAYGFFRRRYGDVQSLEHGGATQWFHSNMVAVPELGFGVFVSTNTDSGRTLAAELPALLLERYFPRARAAALPAPPKDFATAGQVYTGRYLGERRPFLGFEKVLLSTNAVVGVTPDGYLTVTAGGETTRWVQEKAHVFRALQGSGRLAFLADSSGRITGFVSPGGHDVFDRIGTLQTSRARDAVLALAVVVALGVLTGAWLRRRQRRNHRCKAVRSARWLYATAAAWVVLAIVLGTAMAQLVGSETHGMYSYPGLVLTVALWLAVLVLLLTVVCLLLLWPVWRTHDWNAWRKARHTLAVLVFASAGCALWIWNVVGWKV